jgi:hypothetical protein
MAWSPCFFSPAVGRRLSRYLASIPAPPATSSTDTFALSWIGGGGRKACLPACLPVCLFHLPSSPPLTLYPNSDLTYLATYLQSVEFFGRGNGTVTRRYVHLRTDGRMTRFGRVICWVVWVCRVGLVRLVNSLSCRSGSGDKWVIATVGQPLLSSSSSSNSLPFLQTYSFLFGTCPFAISIK